MRASEIYDCRKRERESEREMQKKEQSKGSAGAAGGGTTASGAKRGRPFGSTAGSSSLLAAHGDSAAPSTLLGPSLHVQSSFADQNNKRIVLALQSGIKSELTWALNTLTLLSFKEKDDIRRDATPLAKIPGLLDALLQVVDDWRDVAYPKDASRPSRIRTLGTNCVVSGFGFEYDALGSSDTVSSLSSKAGSANSKGTPNKGSENQPSQWWFQDDVLFNLDEDGRAERQQSAVAASNIIRNFSFMPENETIMAQHRHCLETVFQCINDHLTEDEELVTNALETIVNLAPLLDLRIFSSSKASYIDVTEKDAAKAIMGMLNSPIKAWHLAASELLGRLIINPDNEPFLLPFFPQIYKRLVDILSMPAADAQAAAVAALFNLVEVNMDCRLRLASERWAIERLLRVIRQPHPVPEVSRKAAMILESLASEPQNRAVLMAHENTFAEMLFSDSRHSDSFARILYELTSRPNTRVAAARGIWGM